MINKEEKIQDLRNKISYWTEQLKTINNQEERGVISDKILNAKKEIGFLESKALDRVKKVDIIDALPVIDRLNMESNKSRTGMFKSSTKDRIVLSFKD